ncbi:hypothetical protein LPJ66_001384 [Kickxella alabastrina]|uniref:Uncharacterized protein n=1 Tax=Kickxella alabastrina TaxID=61397 RepID=A0ACC1ITQ6_9FUNG|nr:hypothetical protein LPJ66_001384 [Kickxella alabastrina]
MSIPITEEGVLNIKEAMVKDTKLHHSDQFRYMELPRPMPIETSTQREITERAEFIYNCWKEHNDQQIL